MNQNDVSQQLGGKAKPYAYESGLGTRWVVQSHIKGDAQLNFDLLVYEALREGTSHAAAEMIFDQTIKP